MHAAIERAVDALLFDLGGVIIEIDFGRTFATWASFSGVSAETIAGRFRIDAAYEAHERGEIEAREFFASLRQTLAINLTDEQFAAGWNAMLGREISGIRHLLHSASDVLPLYLFSNTNATHVECFMREHRELLHPFRGLFMSSDLKLRKPTVAAFHAVAQKINLPPERIAFFDDMAENVAGARAAGLQSFQVRSAADTARTLRNELGIGV
jgi:glucose-1-phosphatase